MILVLGATGNVGGEVTRQLIAEGERPRVLVRTPAKAGGFQGRAEVAQGDLEQPESLAAAMRGIDKLFLISSGANLTRLEANAIDAAARAGVQHVVKLSVLGADAPTFVFARWHAAAERRLVDSGLRWTMLRPGNFMTNSLLWAESVGREGKFYQPSGEGRWAAIDPADVGAVAVAALTTPGHEGKSYTLTGPESLSAAGYAQVLARVLGTPVAFVDVPPDAARQAMLAGGIPADYVEAVVDLNAAMKAGTLDAVTSEVERVAGRKAGTFEAWARRNAAAFRGPQPALAGA